MEALSGESGCLERDDSAASPSGVAVQHLCSMDVADSDVLGVEDL